ncbi:MAG: PmoA family protein, partial [Verrucomicrobiales bacterium]|nr:PmoA family protein [Verrucomicrobiales bacterium]
MKHSTRFFCLATAMLTCSLVAEGIILSQAKGRIDVKIDGQLFTSYHYEGVPKPALYPLRWLDGTGLTRRYPMEPAAAGESNDHKHHRSLFWGHRYVRGGKANGIHDFWGETTNSGKQVATNVRFDKNGVIHTKNKWVSKAGEIIGTDSREIRFTAGKNFRIIDYSITIYATHGTIVLMDDKDAGMGIRVPDSMCVTPHGTAKLKAEGYMLNSEGVTGAALWGKRAKWVDYSGRVEGKLLGVSIFDHPQNPKHPTSWHARSYGLCTANIFGKHHFERLKDKNAGNVSLNKSESLAFKYRFYWHPGKGEAKKIEARYREWVA